MRDSDPRPMPEVVKRSYRIPTQLRVLLRSTAYSDADRRDVRDDLLDELVRHRGMVEVSDGKGRYLALEDAIASIDDVDEQISMIVSAEDYGGQEETLPYLARAMEPRWLQWWEGDTWSGFDDVGPWSKVIPSVIGARQSVWLAAQCARRVLRFVPDTLVNTAVASISAAELWAIDPSADSRKKVTTEAARSHKASEGLYDSDPLGSIAVRTAYVSTYAASMSASAFAISSDPHDTAAGELHRAIASCAQAIARSNEDPYSSRAQPNLYPAAYGQVHDLLRMVFAPTLLSFR